MEANGRIPAQDGGKNEKRIFEKGALMLYLGSGMIWRVGFSYPLDGDRYGVCGSLYDQEKNK